jgi:hypothetical protein
MRTFGLGRLRWGADGWPLLDKQRTSR